MTVSVLRNQVQYTGNGSTTAFTVNFPYTEKSQIKVYLGTSLQTITTHYTLTDPDSTGTVTFGTAPGTGVVITILRETDFLQTVDYANNDILDAEVLESAFDKLTMMCQQVKGLVDKSVGFDETVSEAETTSLKLASGTGDLAGKLLAFDDSGNFVTTQEIGTFRGNDTTTTTAAYVVRDLIRDSSNDNVYFTKVDAPAGTLLTNTTYFELLVDVETVRTLKVAAETARTGAETAETNAEAALASFQGQYKSSTSDPYGGSADAGDLWYDETNSILKYYTGSAFEPVTTSLANVTGNYLTISNQVITAGTVPVSLGGTGSTNAADARTALGVDPAGTDNSTDVTLAGSLDYLTISGQAITRNAIDLTTDVTGALPVANGGTGSTTASGARTALGVDPAGTDNSTDVTLATVTGNYLSLSGQQITAGTVPVSLGGTGSTTASDARTALGVDPAGTDNSTDVTLVTTSHDYLSLSSQAITLGAIDLTADVTGTLPVANGGTGVTALSSLNAADLGSNNGVSDATDGYVLTADGTGGTAWEAATGGISDGDKGDITVSSSGATWTIDNAAVSYAKIQNVSATDKILGRSTAGAGSIEEITCTSAGRALLDDVDASAQRGTLGLGTIATQAANSVSITGGSITGVTDIAIADGGTGASTEAAARSNLLPSYSGNGSKVLALNSLGTDVEWVTQSQVFTAGVANAFEHANSISDSITVTSGNNRLYMGDTTFSGTLTIQGKMVILDGPINLTGTMNLTGTLSVRH